MKKEEVEKQNKALDLAISKVILDFAKKHPEGNQTFFIMQAVLCEHQSNIEYPTGRMAPFTNRQIDHICWQIGEWYLMMKPLLEGQHNLGFMKEKLKTMIIGE